jgi:hypothetical protein
MKLFKPKKLTEREQLIENIATRIVSEHRKHQQTQPGPNAWAKIAAHKIVAEHIDSISNKVSICTGCGRLSTDKPIKAPALACCPDCNYIPINEYWMNSKYPKVIIPLHKK